ncbi:MAG: hypothetical protein M1840_006093 [Geoglossum simile]|nr:MAG: hypothetical protein M1840_006093 [Geoglossum simile]
MPSGGCLCEKLTYEYSAGDNDKKVLCHCLGCRKMTSSAFSTNVVVPAGNYQIKTGTPKEYTFNRGCEIHTISFCPDCGTTVSKTVDGLEKFKGLLIVEAGTLNDGEGFGSLKVDMELYTTQRAAWVSEIAGANQVETT